MRIVRSQYSDRKLITAVASLSIKLVYPVWRHTGKVVTSSDWCDCHRRTDHPADLIMFTRVNSVYPITNETNSGWLKSWLLGFWMSERYFLKLLLRFSKEMFVFVWECSDKTRQINFKTFYTQDLKRENFGRVHIRRNRINHFKMAPILICLHLF